MPAIRIPVGMSDVVILLGSQRQAEKATRRILADGRPITPKGIGGEDSGSGAKRREEGCD